MVNGLGILQRSTAKRFVSRTRCSASSAVHRRAGTVTNAGVWYGPGSAAHHAAKGRRAALRPGHGEWLLRLPDRHLQRPNPIDAALNLVPGRERRDAGGRAGHDDIAGAERDLLRQLPDDLRHAPDQFGEVALLPLGAVDREPDLALGRMADLRSRLQRAAGRGVIERLADLPGPLLLARGLLQVAAGEVDADAVAP